jgi:hypothetical protein
MREIRVRRQFQGELGPLEASPGRRALSADLAGERQLLLGKGGLMNRFQVGHEATSKGDSCQWNHKPAGTVTISLTNY